MDYDFSKFAEGTIKVVSFISALVGVIFIITFFSDEYGSPNLYIGLGCVFSSLLLYVFADISISLKKIAYIKELEHEKNQPLSDKK